MEAPSVGFIVVNWRRVYQEILWSPPNAGIRRWTRGLARAGASRILNTDWLSCSRGSSSRSLDADPLEGRLRRV